MRFCCVLLVLLCIGCRFSDPAQSDTARALNGLWHTADGTETLFDFDQNRVTVSGSAVTYTLERIDGTTAYLKDSDGESVTVRLVGDNAAEWRTETTGPFFLTKGSAPPPSP